VDVVSITSTMTDGGDTAGPVPSPDRQATELDLDLKSLANVHNPFPVYRWLRDHEPVHWSRTLNA